MGGRGQELAKEIDVLQGLYFRRPVLDFSRSLRTKAPLGFSGWDKEKESRGHPPNPPPQPSPSRRCEG